MDVDEIIIFKFRFFKYLNPFRELSLFQSNKSNISVPNSYEFQAIMNNTSINNSKRLSAWSIF